MPNQFLPEIDQIIADLTIRHANCAKYEIFANVWFAGEGEVTSFITKDKMRSHDKETTKSRQ